MSNKTMAEVKHTPGPWCVAYLDENGQAVVKGQHTEIATCWHHCVGSIERQMHANARLIAAAPDFFDHAKSLVEAWDARTTGAQQIITGKSDRELQKQAMDAIDGLRAAIARARGEQDGGGE